MSFPKRSDSHIIEDSGFSLFSTLISDGWVVREVTKKDYGIDCFVEICNNNELKGDIIAAQLKSTESLHISSKNNKPYISHSGLKASTLNYLYSIRIPTFIFVIDVTERKVYFDNIKQIIRKNYFSYSKQKLSTIKIPVENIFEPSKGKDSLLYREYNKEDDRKNFETNIIGFISSLMHDIDFLIEHKQRDWHLELELSDSLKITKIYQTAHELALYLNINWKLRSMPELLEESNQYFQNTYNQLHEHHAAEIVKHIAPVISEIFFKLCHLIKFEEQEYWQSIYPAIYQALDPYEPEFSIDFLCMVSDLFSGIKQLNDEF